MRGILGAAIWMVLGGAIAAGAALFFLGGGGEVKLPAPTLLTPPVKTAAPTLAPAISPNCPPMMRTPGRNPSMPKDDIAGVRHGVTVEEAKALILCRNPRFEFQYEPVWHTPLSRNTQSQRQILQARRPGELIVAGLIGDVGQERVAAVWQDETFGLETAPSIAEAAGALAAQFGPPHDTRASDFTQVLIWSYAPDGRPIAIAKPQPSGFAERMAGMFRREQTAETCVRNARLTWLDAPTWNEACGVTIQASIEGQLDDRARVSRLRVAVVDQAALARDVGAFRRQVGAQ